MLTPAELDQLVLRSRDRMNESGAHWIKGSYHDAGRYCSVGALRFEIGGEGEDYETAHVRGDPKYVRIVKVLADLVRREEHEGRYAGEIYGSDGSDDLTYNEDTIIAWNDDSLTEWDDVHRLFTEAAEKLAA